MDSLNRIKRLDSITDRPGHGPRADTQCQAIQLSKLLLVKEAATVGDSTAFLYPWGSEYLTDYVKFDESRDKAATHNLKRTIDVGLYPLGAISQDKAQNLIGMSVNVWECCLNNSDSEGVGDMMLLDKAGRALRGKDKGLHL